MDEPDKHVLREMRQTFNVPTAQQLDRLIPASSKIHRVKVFKSGNSLALRLPKALGLEAGMEMDLEVLPDGTMELRKAPPVKRKFDIDKVWGSATSLKPIDPDNRWFKERKLDWGNSASNESA